MAALVWLLNLGFAASGTAAAPAVIAGRLNEDRGGIGRIRDGRGLIDRQASVAALRAWLDTFIARPAAAPKAKKGKRKAKAQPALEIVTAIDDALLDDALLEELHSLYAQALRVMGEQRRMEAAREIEERARRAVQAWRRRRLDDDAAMEWILRHV